EFFAIQNKFAAISAGFSAQAHRCRVRTSMCFSQCKRGDFSPSDAWQIFLFLFFGPEQQKRLRNADRLMRGNEGGDISIPAAKQTRGTSIIRLRQTKSAIFLRHLDSKRPEFRKAAEIFRWNFASAIDLIGIDMLAQVGFQLLQKFLTG